MPRWLRVLCAALLATCVLSGCMATPNLQERQFTAMDTFMYLTAYGPGAQTGLDKVQEDILFLESLLDATEEGSEVYGLNHRTASSLTLSPELTALLEQALLLAKQTGGAFDPTVYPLVQAWGFTTGAYQVPEPRTLEELLPLVDYAAPALVGNTLTLPADVELDFGGIAKGWAGDRAVQLLKGCGVTSAILRLGGNIQTIGSKPDGSPWRVGIQDPATENTLAVVSVVDQAVVTSGSYQRYFTVNGQLYHHIIDPDTGHPVNNGLASVTVIGDYGTRCDALSTALFVMGGEQASAFWRTHRDFEAVFIYTDGRVAITAGLTDAFSLMDGYTGRQMEVLE